MSSLRPDSSYLKTESCINVNHNKQRLKWSSAGSDQICFSRKKNIRQFSTDCCTRPETPDGPCVCCAYSCGWLRHQGVNCGGCTAELTHTKKRRVSKKNKKKRKKAHCLGDVRHCSKRGVEEKLTHIMKFNLNN